MEEGDGAWMFSSAAFKDFLKAVGVSGIALTCQGMERSMDGIEMNWGC
jgi:hypothetical protein